MANKLTSKTSRVTPKLQLGLGDGNAATSTTFSNPIRDAENLIAQGEKDLEAKLFNTVAGSNVVDPNSESSVDTQIEGKLINALTGGAAKDEDQLENLLINSIFGAPIIA